MQLLEKELLEGLSQIKGNGSFVTSHAASFVFPGLTVKGLDEIAYPINKSQAELLIKVAHRAPFGKGKETILDKKVRSAWEIDAENLHFRGGLWNKFLQKVLDRIKPELGMEEHEIEAHLYKMLIYEKGDFFLPHKDTEKEKGMFGTMIFGLPSSHIGGELLVRFDGEERVIDFAEEASNYKIPYVAFYADCEHEIKPLKEGYRVCLVYNLVQQESGKTVSLEPLAEHVTRLASILKRDTPSQAFSPGIVLLGHQYTPENFSKAQLKLNDRTLAEALIRAAECAEYYAKMCLVTSYIAGSPAYDGYGGDDDVDDDAEMEEVYEESITIEHWLDDGTPPLRNMEIGEKDLMTTFQLNDGDPIQKESTGYMGNYGPDLMHWYHYGAVVFWPKKEHLDMLGKQNIPNQLEWIGYYNTKRKQLSVSEIVACETILNSLRYKEESGSQTDYNVIADWLIGYDNEACFEAYGYRLLEEFFEKIKEESWLALVEAYPLYHFEKIFKQAIQKGSEKVAWHLLAILYRLSRKGSGKLLVAKQMELLPEYFQPFTSGKLQKPLVNAASITYLLQLEALIPQGAKWVEQMGTILSQCQKRIYINTLLIPAVLMEEEQTPLAKYLLAYARNDLQKRVNNIPHPPANWTRAVPNASRNEKLWEMLADFLQSPVDMVFDFRKNQKERDELESAIRHVVIDLHTETIRKGSPHILRITKTQRAYEKQKNEWLEDEALLKKLSRKIG